MKEQANLEEKIHFAIEHQNIPRIKRLVAKAAAKASEKEAEIAKKRRLTQRRWAIAAAIVLLLMPVGYLMMIFWTPSTPITIHERTS